MIHRFSNPSKLLSLGKFAFWILLGLFIAAPANAQQVSKIQGTCFGPITWHVVLPKIDSEKKSTELQNAINTRLGEINDRMSTYQAESEVSRFNKSQSTDWFPVSKETANVVSRSLEISDKTQGCFDITVGPLVSAWKFGAGKGKESFQLLSKDSVNDILKDIGYRKLQVRMDPPAIKKSNPKIQIDLSAIAKGYAVDEVGRVVAEAGITNYFVQVGEEVLAKGKHPQGRDWICGIEKPVVGEQVVDIKVPVKDIAIATSGDYRQFHEFQGKRYSHAIDPKSGFPADSDITLASISAKDCMTADALATAVMVGGEKVAKDFDVGIRVVRIGDKQSSDQSPNFLAEQNDLYPKPISNSTSTGSASPIYTIGITVLVFGLFLLLMSVGVIFANKPIKGSCGGISSLPGNEGKSGCELCKAPSPECKKRMEEEAQKAAEAKDSVENSTVG